MTFFEDIKLIFDYKTGIYFVNRNFYSRQKEPCLPANLQRPPGTAGAASLFQSIGFVKSGNEILSIICALYRVLSGLIPGLRRLFQAGKFSLLQHAMN